MAKTTVTKEGLQDGSRSAQRGNEASGPAAATARNGRANGAAADAVALERVEAALRAAAAGDFSVRLPGRRRDTVGRLEAAYNQLAARNAALADEVMRVAREVGTDGKLGGQAKVAGVAGTWKDLTDSVNFMARNLTDQVRNIADVTTSVARGDLSRKITVDVKGEILELKDT